jgi:hypothetical protein
MTGGGGNEAHIAAAMPWRSDLPRYNATFGRHALLLRQYGLHSGRFFRT